MAHELHIERDGGIPLKEWIQAVASVPGIRLDSSPMTATNPATGEHISIGGRDGDVAVEIDGKWVKAFRFFEDSASFKSGPINLSDPDHPLVRAAFTLARLLSAKVVGEESEGYESP